MGQGVLFSEIFEDNYLLRKSELDNDVAFICECTVYSMNF